ncbi:MAG: hypothetical protein MHM6MM_004853 [Cercozoa sp. M6MM]
MDASVSELTRAWQRLAQAEAASSELADVSAFEDPARHVVECWSILKPGQLFKTAAKLTELTGAKDATLTRLLAHVMHQLVNFKNDSGSENYNFEAASSLLLRILRSNPLVQSTTTDELEKLRVKFAQLVHVKDAKQLAAMAKVFDGLTRWTCLHHFSNSVVMLAIASLLLAGDDSYRSELVARMDFSVLVEVMPLLPPSLLDSPVLQEAMMTSLAGESLVNFEWFINLELVNKWLRTCRALIDHGAKPNKDTGFFPEPVIPMLLDEREVVECLVDNMVYKDTLLFAVKAPQFAMLLEECEEAEMYVACLAKVIDVACSHPRALQLDWETHDEFLDEPFELSWESKPLALPGDSILQFFRLLDESLGDHGILQHLKNVREDYDGNPQEDTPFMRLAFTCALCLAYNWQHDTQQSPLKDFEFEYRNKTGEKATVALSQALKPMLRHISEQRKQVLTAPNSLLCEDMVGLVLQFAGDGVFFEHMFAQLVEEPAEMLHALS